MSYALEAIDLVKRYGKQTALNKLNLRVPEGSIMGLVGSNGAGKTTLMSIAAGLVRKTAGEIQVLGHKGFDTSVHSGRVTILPQDSGMPYYTRVEEILLYYAKAQGMSGRAASHAVDEVLEWTNLTDRRKFTVRSLSHGMFRRLTVAQAFLGQPELIMLDEPMSGLDPKEVAKQRELILSGRGKRTVIVSSHILSEVETLCDEIAFIDLGVTQRQESLSEILKTHRHIRYHLGSEPPLEKIQAIEQVEAIWIGDTGVLDIQYLEPLTIESVNEAILPLLLEAQCPVAEIRRGGDLEQVYLNSGKSD